MTDEFYRETASHKRKWLILLAIVAGWFALKDPIYRAIVSAQPLPETSMASYDGDEGWAVLPIEPPPGAWEDPWGVDLFILPPPSGAAAGRGLVGPFHGPTVDEAVKASHEIEKTLALAGPSYSALYRHPSASETSQTSEWDVARQDIAMAFERYLYTRNNMRGILLVASPGTEDLVPPILARIESDPRLLERFSGVLLLLSPGTTHEMTATCSPAMQGQCVVIGELIANSNWLSWMTPNLHRSTQHIRFANPETLSADLTSRNTGLSIWLDNNAPKPAEPLGGIEDIEVVDVAPIRRPGETDEESMEEQEMTD